LETELATLRLVQGLATPALALELAMQLALESATLLLEQE